MILPADAYAEHRLQCSKTACCSEAIRCIHAGVDMQITPFLHSFHPLTTYCIWHELKLPLS